MKSIKLFLLAAFAFVAFVISSVNVTAQTFYDVYSIHWAEKEIDYWSAAGIIKGYGDWSFRPNDNITRAEAAKIIALVSNYETTINHR